MVAQNNRALSLPEQVHDALRDEILLPGDPTPSSILLYDLVNGYTTGPLAALDILKIVSEASNQPYSLEVLTTEIASLACQYLVLHCPLLSLISSIYSLPEATTSRSAFLSSLSLSFGELNQSSYAELFKDSNHTPSLIREYLALHAFYGRLLGTIGLVSVSKERISGLSDALFIMSISLEDEKPPHNNPTIDVSAAAMYIIHSGETLHKESRKGTGQDLATNSPLWNSRGKLWTGKPGLNIERWEFWKKRFEHFASDDLVSREVKDIARTAVRIMENFSRSGFASMHS